VTISFARGVPPPECLPIEQLADCSKAALERDGATLLNYGPIAGYGPLREWIAERHGVDPARVFVTNGSLQAFVLLAQQLVQPGDAVVVEAPTYDRPLKILARLGAEITPVPLADDGLDLDALEAVLAERPAPALLYTIPTFQNPSGRTLSEPKRRRLAELAADRALTVLEDDPYGLVRFEGSSPPTLFELARLADGDARIVYMSSFSKIVSPGARVAYLILPPDLVAPIEAQAVQTYLAPSFLAQGAVHEFLRRGYLEPSLERVCAVLRERRDAMLTALDSTFPAETAWSRPEGGYFLWLDLPTGTDAAELLERATADGVTFVNGADFFPAGAARTSSARLAYSFAAPPEIAAGIERLNALLRTLPLPVTV
jgi:2-aminoadipate transaminase